MRRSARFCVRLQQVRLAHRVSARQTGASRVRVRIAGIVFWLTACAGIDAELFVQLGPVSPVSAAGSCERGWVL